jgi:hypothetical protein
MNPSELVALHLQIDNSMKSILKDGKLDKHDIPDLVFLLSGLMLTPTAKNKLTPEMLTTRLDELYAYVMTHYNLYPADDLEKTAYKQLFDISVKLLVYNPRLMKAAKSCMPCVF